MRVYPSVYLSARYLPKSPDVADIEPIKSKGYVDYSHEPDAVSQTFRATWQLSVTTG